MARGVISVWLLVMGLLVIGCEEPEPPITRIEVAPEHRGCTEEDTCAVVQTSCSSTGCECGVAVNTTYLLDYQQQLADCRGQKQLAECDIECKTPFAKCYEGVCVLTDEPVELFKRGRSVLDACEQTGGEYVGCPDCPPNTRCGSCQPCQCQSTHRWTSKGCRRIVMTEPRDVLVELRPERISVTQPLKTRIQNQAKRTIRVKTLCGTPFYRARRKEDAWEVVYELVPRGRCKPGSIEIDPREKRPFVVQTLSRLSDPSGKLAGTGTYRFELVYTDVDQGFRHYDTVYSPEFDAVSKRARR